MLLTSTLSREQYHLRSTTASSPLTFRATKIHEFFRLPTFPIKIGRPKRITREPGTLFTRALLFSIYPGTKGASRVGQRKQLLGTLYRWPTLPPLLSLAQLPSLSLCCPFLSIHRRTLLSRRGFLVNQFSYTPSSPPLRSDRFHVKVCLLGSLPNNYPLFPGDGW